MPSTSLSQHNLAEFVEHDPEAARRAGIRMSPLAAREFVQADKGRDLKRLPNKVSKNKSRTKPVFGSLSGG